MEDVLDLDGEPYDPQRPTICSDETSIQFIGEGRVKLPPGGDSQRGLTLTITKDRQ